MYVDHMIEYYPNRLSIDGEKHTFPVRSRGAQWFTPDKRTPTTRSRFGRGNDK